MKHEADRRFRGAQARAACVLAVTVLAWPVVGQHVTQGLESGEPINVDHPSSPRAFLLIPGPTVDATLYATGEHVPTETETLWRPMCGSAPGATTAADLAALAARRAARQAKHQQEAQPQAGGDETGLPPEGGIAGGGFNIQFNLDGSVPGPAVAAIAEVEAYLESKFSDNMTVVIDIDFDDLGAGVLGATSSTFTKASWNNVRNGLQDGMDDDDNIQNYLPDGSTIPVRYNGNNDTITNENRVYFTLANYRATIGSISGVVGSMTFNTDFTWDYDPSDGVVGSSFRDTLAHECGHALGFTSGADFRTNDMEALDIFRFQYTGGGHDYNPDTTSEFEVRPRLVSKNKPNDDCVCDVINKEYRMSDGSPYQAAHFREQFPSLGLMDPALAGGETRYPNYLAASDLRMLDAIGYDR